MPLLKSYNILHLFWDFFSAFFNFWIQVGDNGVSYNSPFTYDKKSKDYSYFVDMEDARETYEPEKVFQWVFFRLTMITTTFKMFISCTPCVLLEKLVKPFLSPDRISTRIWNKKIVSFWRHYSSISSTLPWVPTSRSIVHLVHHSQSLLLRLLSHVLTILSYSAFIIALPITYWICIKRVSAVIIILTKVIRIKERANSVNNCQQRERWRTGWNEPKDDRLPSWKDDRSQRAGHRPCISMAW